jgi:hypothetical protein
MVEGVGTGFERQVNEEVDRIEEEAFNDGGGEAEAPAPGELLSALDDSLATAKTEEEVETIYDDYDIEAQLQTAPQGEEFIGVAIGIKRRHLKRVANA